MFSHNVLELTIFCGLFIYLCTTAGAAVVFLPFKRNNNTVLQLSLGFSAGIMLAAGIFSLILPAVEICENNGSSLYPVGLGFVLGVLFLILMDRTMPHLHYNESAPEGIKSHFGRGTLLFLAITIHNIPEGMAVGISSAGGVTDEQVIASLILALGIGIQNIPEGAAVSMPCFAEGMSRFKAFVRGSLSGIVEPVAAILMVLLAEHLLPFLPWFLSFAAGAMIYVVVEELIPESHSLGHSDKATVSVLSGFLLMMMLDITLG